MKVKVKKEVFEYLLNLNYEDWKNLSCAISTFFETEYKLREKDYRKTLYLDDEEVYQKINKGLYTYPITLQFEDK